MTVLERLAQVRAQYVAPEEYAAARLAFDWAIEALAITRRPTLGWFMGADDVPDGVPVIATYTRPLADPLMLHGGMHLPRPAIGATGDPTGGILLRAGMGTRNTVVNVCHEMRHHAQWQEAGYPVPYRRSKGHRRTHEREAERYGWSALELAVAVVPTLDLLVRVGVPDPRIVQG